MELRVVTGETQPNELVVDARALRAEARQARQHYRECREARQGERETLSVLERRCLEESVVNLGRYISELPDASQWKWTFAQIRGELAQLLDGEPRPGSAERSAEKF